MLYFVAFLLVYIEHTKKVSVDKILEFFNILILPKVTWDRCLSKAMIVFREHHSLAKHLRAILFNL